MEDTKKGINSGRTPCRRELLPCSLEKFTPKKVGHKKPGKKFENWLLNSFKIEVEDNSCVLFVGRKLQNEEIFPKEFVLQ